MFATKQWQINKMQFVGGSLAGIGTSIGSIDFGVCFDVANGPRHTLKFNDFLITHAHSDHAAGIPYICSQKAMNGQKKFRFYVPAEIEKSLREVIRMWEALEDHELPGEIIGVSPGDTIELSPKLLLKPFRTVHRVSSLGYSLISRKKKLKKEYRHLSGSEIAKLRQQGESTEEWREIPEISFTGDTQIDLLERSPELLESRFLFFEVTFYDDKKPPEEARKWGHTHFDEILPYLSSFKGERFVLMHPSARYRRSELNELMRKRAGDHFERLFLAPSLYS